MENKKKFDIIFAGRIVKEKNPLFFAKVAILIKNKLGSCKALVIGDGDENLKKQMFNLMESNAVEYHYAGFIEHDRLPDFYGLSKILLLPTSGDCWGVVINEAMISGLPVITTPMTAAAGELVVNEKSGFVLPLDPDIWASKSCDLLINRDTYDSFSTHALIYSKTFNFQRAAQGIIDSIKYANRYCT
jgi:glycosyltransferase involved in cell wall biosynthesis